MQNKQINKRFIYILISLFLLVVAVISGRFTLSAFADTSEYTDVLDDLKKDSNFSETDYKSRGRGDYSVSVIQIAESNSGELFVYTFQPHFGKPFLEATDINMSTSESVDGTRLYVLTLISSNGNFGKYKVNDIKVNADSVRYYNITSIYRELLSGIDNDADNGNIKNKKACDVGQCWQATTQGDTVTYKMVKVDIVEIINPFTSYVRRSKNQSSNGYFQDSYYVAFSTTRNIEKLISATVSYRIQDYFYKENNVLGFDNTDFWNKSTFSNEKRMQKDVYCDEVNELQQDGYNLFGVFDLNKHFSWNRIQSSADFVKNAGASSSDNDEVKKLQWVLMFDETSVYRYESGGLIERCEETGQIIDEVTVLRLEFVEDGKTYNLGTVSDVVSKDFDFGNQEDDGTDDGKEEQGFFAYVWGCIVKLFNKTASSWEKVVAITAIVVTLIVLGFAVGLIKWLYRKFFK